MHGCCRAGYRQLRKDRNFVRGPRSLWHAVCLVLGTLSASGCTSLLSPINSVPARRLPVEILPEPRANKVSIDLAYLRRDPPEEYHLDAGDVLAIYVEGVLGGQDSVPPIHYPERGSDTLPGLGYPTPVRDDGTISLPMLEPIPVRGMTVAQVHQRIRELYVQDREILRPELDRILVTLTRRRTTRVIVIREDGGGERALPGGGSGRVIAGSAAIGRGFVLSLPANHNDVLHALAETGGLPGLNAKNEVKILRSTVEDRAKRDAFLQRFYQICSERDPCLGLPQPPDDFTVTRIPLRLPPGEVPRIEQEDITLRDGDIVLVETRETEVYYTGGLLPGGQFPLPRDYDLDVLNAIAIAGTPLTTNPMGGLIGGVGGASPSHLYIIRLKPNGQQFTIHVDLNRAITDPTERLLVQAGDTLILRHSPLEEGTNFGLATFFTYGLQRLFAN